MSVYQLKCYLSTSRLDDVDNFAYQLEIELSRVQENVNSSTQTQARMKLTVDARRLIQDNLEDSMQREQYKLQNLTKKTTADHKETKIWVSIVCVGVLATVLFFSSKCSRVESLVTKLEGLIPNIGNKASSSSFWK